LIEFGLKQPIAVHGPAISDESLTENDVM